MKVTLYDYLMWIAEDENNLTPELIEDNLMLTGMTDKQIMAFYNKHKNAVLENYKEQYPNGKYMGMNYYDTIVSFYLDGKYYEMNDVNGSFLNDMEIDSTSTNKIIKIDCDGVLRDMLPAMCDLYNDHYDENLSTEDITDFDVNKIFTKCSNPESFFFEEHSPYIYLNSPKCEKAKEAMDLLHEKDYHIIIVSTQPSFENQYYTLMSRYVYGQLFVLFADKDYCTFDSTSTIAVSVPQTFHQAFSLDELVADFLKSKEESSLLF